MSVVAITGVSGYIGSRLVGLLDQDEKVSRMVGVDLRPPRLRSEKLEFYRLDVRNRLLSRLFQERGVDVVVHLAFVVNPIHDTALMHEIDVEGSRNVFSAAAECGVRQMVIASSTTAFGAFKDNPEWLCEDDPPRRQPNYTYASDKYEVEAMVRDFAEAHPGVVIAVVRPCIVYGPNVDNYLSRFLLDLPVLPGVGGARPEMQFVHEEYAAKVFHRVISTGAEGCYHAVGSGTIGIAAIAEMAGKRIVDFPAGVLYPAVDLLWKMRIPRITGPSGMLEFIRYRWTASDDITRKRLGLKPPMSSGEVARSMLESHGVATF